MSRAITSPSISPDILVAGIPHLLGFIPEESLIVLALRDNPRHPVLATLRVDLPGISEISDRAELVSWLSQPLSTAASMCDAMLIVVWSESAHPHNTTFIDDVTASITSLGVPVVDGLFVHHTGGDPHEVGLIWRSAWCSGLRCCPVAGHEINADHRRAAAGLFAQHNLAPARSRSDLEAELEGDSVGSVPGDSNWRHERETVVREASDVAVIHAVSLLRGHTPATPHDVGLVVEAMSTVRVRDVILWEILTLADVDLSRAAVILADIVRSSPKPAIAPLATVLGIVHWQRGDGVRAMIAIERALGADPEYSLALLIGGCIAHGVHPSTWRGELQRLERRHLAGP